MRSWILAATLALATAVPRVASADVDAITFEDAIKRALEHNPNAELANEEIRRAQALVKEARAGWFPTLIGNGVYTHLDDDRKLGTGQIVAGQDQLGANVVLTVPLVQTRGWSSWSHAKDNVDVAKLSAVDLKTQVAVSVGRAFLTVIAQKRVLENAVRARDTAKAHEDFSRTRFEGGVGNRLDFVRASQESATDQAQVQQQLIALTRAQEQLGVLVGEQGPLDAAGDARLPEAPNLQGALGEAESRRPDVLAQKERVEAARHVSRDTWTEYMPVLNLVAQPFYQNPATLTQPITGWQAQLVLALPLYDGGLRYGLQDERDALHDEAKTRYDAALRQARSDVRTAFEEVRRADDGLTAARDASRLAQEALALAQLAYRAGATGNLEVIDAERRARDADTVAAIAEDTARQARLDLLASCGRFP